ncbi:MAG: helix-turn-helix domain-containing protein [Spiribacter salinus]|uniref:Helix-turn-helix domain-containing protein n=1 Tax=Spiribacter salinus TaxID=1335746 RepID=A0A540VSF4_9GAMM|nr:MAG: helix-turn-helix domain-containing protein [Spiribacter salinus]
MNIESDLLTKQEAAKYLRTSVSAFDRMIKRGEGPPSVKIGKRHLFRRSSIDGWLDDQEQRCNAKNRTSRETGKRQPGSRLNYAALK